MYVYHEPYIDHEIYTAHHDMNICINHIHREHRSIITLTLNKYYFMHLTNCYYKINMLFFQVISAKELNSINMLGCARDIIINTFEIYMAINGKWFHYNCVVPC